MNVGKVSVSLCWLVGNSFWHYLSDPRNQTHCFSRGRCCTHLLLNTRKLGGEANFYNWQNCGSQITLSVLRWPLLFLLCMVSRLALPVLFFSIMFWVNFSFSVICLRKYNFYLSRIPQNDWSTYNTFHSIPEKLCFCFHINTYIFSHFISFEGRMGPVCQIDDSCIKLLILFYEVIKLAYLKSQYQIILLWFSWLKIEMLWYVNIFSICYITYL